MRWQQSRPHRNRHGRAPPVLLPAPAARPPRRRPPACVPAARDAMCVRWCCTRTTQYMLAGVTCVRSTAAVQGRAHSAGPSSWGHAPGVLHVWCSGALQSHVGLRMVWQVSNSPQQSAPPPSVAPTCHYLGCRSPARRVCCPCRRPSLQQRHQQRCGHCPCCHHRPCRRLWPCRRPCRHCCPCPCPCRHPSCDCFLPPPAAQPRRRRAEPAPPQKGRGRPAQPPPGRRRRMGPPSRHRCCRHPPPPVRP